ncbi:bifunctional diaminohydroxyphosphoribosylaminopyrimidine deaminase/5-amino-6-(5-phosphoribosylamino)uracil reductase RibD [Siccirubricoccus sp. KC 17139]|uniref:Riboflavin biosynthesis protein RibD n=1 Tax=Siccirubricoccus soli TaxID=2899147 RepID=A0ABT1D510_9PROT|nr:bifunctional diaminohydroxyphosphoribosylaminopyrimidine deaminase/5-amino-6-(5-phosphoribosylamino)uracil reductase RibD [Siccirubricoccus soli]MCO6417012.1 bifunctional diaminohydroxyphosphoribosylaminopyrimidine deaminase/5-amino-6-(5-phosphoribosylamino)uracil reductase RibD [Siccirubricoccus soli]MCP2683147.1 bifunctional diaminohydroxyphosphoribosylaminopyrimidine deaminase/5-amino-6-(5-phosphoribosylamino)uracil reductase RibD [Siccirubricoccus soli]
MAESDADRAHMRAALALARRGLGNTWPNPAVGCVLVKDDRVVGRGWTQPGGRPHAETQALDRAGEAARGATAYVTLEPCSHWGRTPPCCDALIRAGVRRVVVAAGDPDPRVDGRGLARLREAGVTVETGLFRAEAEALNAGFARRITSGLPLVTLKLATTLDGRIATATGESQWITGPEARRAAHAIRGRHDAILVGSGTVLADDPELTCRLPGMARVPLARVVADSRLRTPLGAKLVATARQVPTWIATRTGQKPAALAPYQEAGVEILTVRRERRGLDLAALLGALAQRGITRVMAEGGAGLAAALLRARLVQHLAWFHAPGIMGGDGLPAVQPLPLDLLSAMPRFRRVSSRPVGADWLSEFVNEEAEGPCSPES